MIKTFGLTHVALAVLDPHRSAVFYSAVFGMKVVYESDDFVQLQTPGLALHEAALCIDAYTEGK